MLPNLPLACLLSLIPPPSIRWDTAMLQIVPVDKSKCPFGKIDSDILFHLHTRDNPTAFDSLQTDDDERLFASNIDFKKNTLIIFLAFMETSFERSAQFLKEAYLLQQDVNIIIVDAKKLLAGPWYVTAAKNTWHIGKITAQFIDYLVSRGLQLSKTHLIGHSLGAQTAGIAGSAIKTGRVDRITGLDPPLLLFSDIQLEGRLDPTDAVFVDVIHTDAGVFGFNRSIGHVDFYPNGGIHPQPGCERWTLLPELNLITLIFCSHMRSFMYYAESVLSPSSFLATRCPSYEEYEKGLCAGQPTTHMGYGVDRTARGSYFLTTNRKSPYSL